MNRQILTSALFQHSSRIQPFKQEALDSIVERIVFFHERKQMSIGDVQKVFVEIVGYTIPLVYFEHSVNRLLKLEKLYIAKQDNDLFFLSGKRRREIEIGEQYIVQNQKKLILNLFSNSPERKDLYVEPFWFALSFIFSNIGDYSAKIVDGSIDKELILFPILEKCIEECKKKYTLNYVFFKQKIVEFFLELVAPHYLELKCVLAQNYFIAKSIGINPGSDNFSRDVFSNQKIYLDTNVLISLISHQSIKHSNSIAFFKALNKVESQICITKITLLEYESWVQGEFNKIRKTINQIPEKTKSKISSPVYKDYYYLCQEKLEQNSECDVELILDNLEKHYLNYKQILNDYLINNEIEYIDDFWFDKISEDEDFDSFIIQIKEKYIEVSVKSKGNTAAIHDAKVLLWINKESKETGKKHIFITTDSSLPLIKFNENEFCNNVLLDSALQWLLPLTNENKDAEIEKTISVFLKQQILPREFIFNIKDFMIFDQLQMDCQELPAEDVEECILYLKNKAPDLNPNAANDREKLASEISKFFLDPSRKFKLELAQLEKFNDELSREIGNIRESNNSLDQQKKEIEKELNDSKTLHESEISILKGEHYTEKESLAKELNMLKSDIQKQKIKNERIKKEKEFKIWQRPGKICLISGIILIIFFIFLLLPHWDFNIAKHYIDYLNDISDKNKSFYQILMGVSLFIFTSLMVILLRFSYKRLFNMDEIKSKRRTLGLEE